MQWDEYCYLEDSACENAREEDESHMGIAKRDDASSSLALTGANVAYLELRPSIVSG